MSSWARIATRIRVPLGFLLAVLYFWLAKPTPTSIVAGAVIALLGVALRAAASGHITKNAALTTTGPYAYTRNPLYVGSIVIAGGFAVAARSWVIVLLMTALFLAIYVPVIRDEEAFLRAQFPDYVDYEKTVPRFFPRFGVRTTDTSGAFSRQRYLHHREYNALIGTAAMLAALLIKMLWLRR